MKTKVSMTLTRKYIINMNVYELYSDTFLFYELYLPWDPNELFQVDAYDELQVAFDWWNKQLLAPQVFQTQQLGRKVLLQ